jgi:hypothetical protein
MKAVVYRAADPEWTIGRNRYKERTIGIYVKTGSLCWSLVWRRP